MNRKKVCILSFSEITWDSRVLREVEAARHIYDVDVIAYGAWDPFPGVHYHQLEKTKRTYLHLLRYFFALLIGRLFPDMYETAFWMKMEYVNASDLIADQKYDLIHANDWNALPVASANSSLKGKSRILFDAHEYSFTEQGDNRLWKFLIVPFRAYLFEKYQRSVGSFITVSDGIEMLYARDYGWKMDVVLNAPAYTASEFHPVHFGKIKLVHHGSAVDSRHLEDFIRMVSLLDERFELSFYLLPTQPKYLDGLKRLAAREGGRINFFEPVHPSQVVVELSKFDIGIPLLSATQSTYYNALPNKFFDFIMAGLAVVVSPLPMMQEIIDRNKIGIISADQRPESMAECLNRLRPETIDLYKRNSLELARQTNADVEMKKLLKIYERLLR